MSCTKHPELRKPQDDACGPCLNAGFVLGVGALLAFLGLVACLRFIFSH